MATKISDTSCVVLTNCVLQIQRPSEVIGKKSSRPCKYSDIEQAVVNEKDQYTRNLYKQACVIARSRKKNSNLEQLFWTRNKSIMFEGPVADTFWIREKSGILVKRRKEKIVRIKYNGEEKKATLEVMSPTDISTITFHQVLDCNKCLLMTDRSFRRGKLALVPSVAFDKHMGRGLVLEHHDQHALQEWEGTLRKHLRVVSYPVRIMTAQNGKKWATLHISPSRLYLSRGFPPKFHMLGSWDIALHADNLVLLHRSIQLKVNYDGTNRLTLATEYARDIFETVIACYRRLAPPKDSDLNIDSIVPSSRRRLASMPTSVRNEMSLRSVTGRSSTLSFS